MNLLKKSFFVVVIMCFALLALTACNEETPIDFTTEEFTAEQAYAYAEGLGFTGTLDEFVAMLSGKDGKDGANGINGTNGADGVGITSLTISADGHLLVTLTNAQTVDCGLLPTVKGEKGDKGDKGDQGIQGEKGEKGDTGATGAKGDKGDTGASGLTPYIGENGNWWLGEEDMGVKALDNVAFYGSIGKNSTWTMYKNGSFVVTGTGSTYDYRNNNSPYEIYSNFATSIRVEEGITKIGYGAFQYFTNVTEVSLPSTLTEIGESAFAYMQNLSSITIPQSVTKMIANAFFGCRALSDIYYAGTSEQWEAFHMNASFYDDGGKLYYPAVHCSDKTLYPNGISVINDNIQYFISIEENEAFVYGIRGETTEVANILTSVTFEDREYPVTTIKDDAFRCAYSLRSAIIPDSVTSIGSSAFYNCSELTSITIGNSVTSIWGSAFYNCSSLTSITIPDSVTSIGGSAFYNCSGLTSITIPDSVTSIGYRAFYSCSSLTSVTIGNGVTSIGIDAFRGCSSLTSVYYTGDIASWCGISFAVDGGGDIYYYYYSCYSNPLYYAHNLYFNNELVTEIVIPDTVTEIKGVAFHGWNGTSVTISDSVTSIGGAAFFGCENLTTIVIGIHLTSVGVWAVGDCGKLSKIYFKGSIEYAGYINNVSLDYDTSDVTFYFYSEEEPEEVGNYWYYDEDGVTILEW